MEIKMTIFYGRGSPEDVITPRDAKEALDVAFEKLGKRCGGVTGLISDVVCVAGSTCRRQTTTRHNYEVIRMRNHCTTLGYCSKEALLLLL